VCTGFGIFDLIRSIVRRSELKGFLKDEEIIEGKEKDCFKLQLYSSVLGAIVVISLGIITVIYRENSGIFIAWMSILYMLIHFAAKSVSKRRGYIEP